MIDLRPEHRKIVLDILAEYLPEYSVKAFGSRAHGHAKPTSDLDLMIMVDQPISMQVVAQAEVAFIDSDLPFTVDLVEKCRFKVYDPGELVDL